MRTTQTTGLVTLAVILAVSWSDAANTKRPVSTASRTVTPAAQTKRADNTTTLDPVATPRPVEGTSPSVSPTPGDNGMAPVSTLEQVPSTTDEEKAPDVATPDENSQASAGTVSYDIQWQSVNSGGAPISSATYNLSSTVGQAAIGTMSSSSYTGQVGYWYGAFAVATDCACDCHADPECDGVTNVLDVVNGVNVAFRGGTDIPDPDARCPYVTTDINCDGVTNVLDVVHLVNVAFRGGDPTAEFCVPCPE